MEQFPLRRLVGRTVLGVRPSVFHVLILVLGIALAAGCAAERVEEAYEEASGPGQPGPDDACPVCGMLVAPYPEWVAQVTFEDGSSAFFDGCKDMFKYLLARDRYLPEKRQMPIQSIHVTDYYDLVAFDGHSAHFVIGSDVLGPMGHELVPLASPAAAEEFSRDHGGTRIVRFEDVTPELLSGLN